MQNNTQLPVAATTGAPLTTQQAAAKLAELADNLGDQAARAIAAAKAARPTMRYGAAIHALAGAFAGTGEEDELCQGTARQIVELVNIVYSHDYTSLGPNPILTAAEEFIAKCREFYMSDEHDTVTDNWGDEAPMLHGPARYYEGAAALALAAFGSELIPDLNGETTGCAAQNALKIANVYLSEPVMSPLVLAFEALALLALRYQTEEVGDAENE